MIPYILTCGILALYFFTEAKKNKKYPTAAVAVSFLVVVIATYFRAVVVAAMTYHYIPLVIMAWMNGSLIQRIMDPIGTMKNLWERLKGLFPPQAEQEPDEQ